MYGLVDVNSMYASAEKVFEIQARRTGVIVLSNNDFTVVAMDKLAKSKLGDLKFQPYFKIEKQVKAAGVTVRSSNYELYGYLSSAFMSVLSRYGIEQHPYSIDEAFILFDDTQNNDWEALGKEIRRTVWKEVRLPVCVGFGCTPTLAKVANHIAKKTPATGGACYISSHNKDAILQKIPVANVWGIGHRLSSHLSLQGIKTAWDLMRQPPKLMRKTYSVNMERTIRELQGEVCLSWNERPPKHQIFSTRSFGEKVHTLTELKQSLVFHAEIVTRKARRQGSMIKMITAFAHSSPFADKPLYRKSTYHGFFDATNDVRDIAAAVSQAAERIFMPGVSFHKSGVGALELVNGKLFQQDLFAKRQRDPRLMNVVDLINGRFGSDTVGLAGKGINNNWKMKRQMKSPNYMTSWSDIIRINT